MISGSSPFDSQGGRNGRERQSSHDHQHHGNGGGNGKHHANGKTNGAASKKHDGGVATGDEDFDVASLRVDHDSLMSGALGERKVNRIAALIVALDHGDPEKDLKKAVVAARLALSDLRSLSVRVALLGEHANGDASQLRSECFRRLYRRLVHGQSAGIDDTVLGIELLKVYETPHMHYLPDLGDWLGMIEDRGALRRDTHARYREALHKLDRTEGPSWAARLREQGTYREHHGGD